MKYTLVTNDPELSKRAYESGIERIMIDLEVPQRSTKNYLLTDAPHKSKDISLIVNAVPRSEVVVRVNGPQKGRFDAGEFESAIDFGAHYILAPFVSTVDEVRGACELIVGRVGCIPLIETPQALIRLEEISFIPGVSELYLGLHDLATTCGVDYLFEPLAGGFVDLFASVARNANVPFGFTGLSANARGLPVGYIIAEHERVGSTRMLLPASVFKDCRALEEYKGVVRSLEDTYNQARLRSEFERRNDMMRTFQAIRSIVGEK